MYSVISSLIAPRLLKYIPAFIWETVSNPRAVDGFSNFILGSLAVFLNNELIDKLIPGIMQPPK